MICKAPKSERTESGCVGECSSSCIAGHECLENNKSVINLLREQIIIEERSFIIFMGCPTVHAVC